MKPLLLFGLFFLTIFKHDAFGQMNTSIEQYFKSLDTSKKQSINQAVLQHFQSYIELSEIDVNHSYLISSDNADAAAFSQVILATWLKERRYKKVALTSCAPTQAISEAGLKTLQSIGYKVDKKGNEYYVQYADKDKPIKFALLPCSHKKAINADDLELRLTAETTSTNEYAFHYQPGNTDDIFRSLATEFYAVINGLKKD